MKRILAAVMVLTMLFAICMIPAMAETTKESPELGTTVIIPGSTDAKEDGVDYSYNKPASHPYVFVFETTDGYAIVWSASKDVKIESGKAVLPENSYVAVVSTIAEVEELVYGAPKSVSVTLSNSVDAKAVVINPSTVGEYYVENVKTDKPAGKPVTSPDTSDVFGLVLGALAVVDGAAVTYYLKSRKAK